MTKRELWEKAKMLPLLPGVYIIRDKTGEIIYIGKAKRCLLYTSYCAIFFVFFPAVST